jgi:hypothetical protein
MPFVPPRPKDPDIKLTDWPTLNLCPCTKHSIMSNGFACHLAGGTKQLQLSASWEVLYHEIARWGARFYFVVKWRPPSWQRIGPGRGRLTLKETRTHPQRWSMQMTVEKSAFTALPAADVARRAIATFARYREPSHCRSIFKIAVTLVPFVALGRWLGQRFIWAIGSYLFCRECLLPVFSCDCS